VPDNATAPAPTSEPTKIPPPVAAGSQGAGALVDGATKDADPYEFDDLEIKGQKQKLKFSGKDQLKAVLQKALYADQAIKDGTQAKKGAEAMMAKLKTAQGLREVLSDPAIGLDLRKFVLDEVRAMMDDERLTPEERESRDAKRERDELKTWKEQREQSERDAAQKAKNEALANQTRREIISAMDKFPDIPKTQATMDAVIQNMRAAFRKYGKHLTPDQAMTVYSQQYWQSLQSVIEKLDPDVIVKKFGQKTLDKIQKLKLQELKDKTDPGKKSVPGETANLSKKKNLTEREYDKLFTQRLAGL
jgi:hypothetical protein